MWPTKVLIDYSFQLVMVQSKNYFAQLNIFVEAPNGEYIPHISDNTNNSFVYDRWSFTKQKESHNKLRRTWKHNRIKYTTVKINICFDDYDSNLNFIIVFLNGLIINITSCKCFYIFVCSASNVRLLSWYYFIHTFILFLYVYNIIHLLQRSFYVLIFLISIY